MEKKLTIKQIKNASRILISWKKAMPYYFSIAIIAVLLIILFPSLKTEKNFSRFEKYILEFQKGQNYINKSRFEKHILEFQKGQNYINS